MKFQFNVNTCDQDYLDYNKFWMLRSHYGKKQMTTFRVILAVIIGVYIFISLYGDNFTFDSFNGIIPILIYINIIPSFQAHFIRAIKFKTPRKREQDERLALFF